MVPDGNEIAQDAAGTGAGTGCPASHNERQTSQSRNRAVPRLLIISRAIRGVGQGMMLADFVLYLKALGWDAAVIGILLALGAIGEIAASIFVGWAGDRGTKKRFLILGEALTFTAFCMAAYSTASWVLGAAALLGGLGQRSNGSPGPFSPSEQSLFAHCSPSSRLGAVLSINSATGFAGLGAGALVGGCVLSGGGLSGARVFRPLFIISAVLSLANIFLLAAISEPPRSRIPKPISLVDSVSIRSSEARSLCWLALTNLLNGIAIGMADLLAPYWFAKQFHAKPLSISLLMAVTFFLTALMACAAAFMIYRTGHLRFLLRTQFMSAGLLVIFPLIPIYWLAFMMLAVRYALTRSPAGVRQTLTNALVRRHRIGLATSLNVSSLQAGQLFAPYFAGLLIDRGRTATPFFLAAICQAIAVLLYKCSFHEPLPDRTGA